MNWKTKKRQNAEEAARLTHQLTGFLWELAGGTADGVADILRAEGVTGYAQSSYSSCPVANYLAIKMNHPMRVFPSRAESAFKIDVSQVMPASVQEFIYRFDKGEYPDLEKKDDASLRTPEGAGNASELGK